ncbi:hypothetical protein BK133_11985 [Paenibacillus sp. FSL H8-0548]|uniref:hypothetical protein n=1 Tax=Paenibacillus sp. FSL H8-0548 TaxID=1920422 RepID=UPI00096EAF3B|nr:hypothetical protein [Paenibacillus sp. FSL H8-0548]OMF34719.1 hypothetical protein BK133_11985 [Paenibacillus sp. FSL H8-0548]
MKQILIFVLFAGLLCWLMFSPIYKHVLIVRQAVLQQEVDYLLEIGASGTYGYISEEMQEQSRQRLSRFGLLPAAIEFELATTSGLSASDPSSPLIRGTGLSLTMSYPYDGLFEIDRLLGLTPPSEDERIRAFGMKMSEYVP